MEAAVPKISNRVAGVALYQGHVLLHRAESDDFWSLPGGQIEHGETAQAALIREMREEIATEVTAGRLLYVVENFFTYREIRFHEIGLYFEMHFAPGSPLLNLAQITHGTEAFWILEPNAIKLYFEWTPLDGLGGKIVKPHILMQELPLVENCTTIRHIFHDDTR